MGTPNTENSDIYKDLNSVDLGEKITKLENRNRYLMSHVEKLTGDIEKLCKELTLMKQKEGNLKTNISELYKSSKLEIERKNRAITDLQNKLHNLTLARGNRRPPTENVQSDNQRYFENDCKTNSKSRSKSPHFRHYSQASNRLSSRSREYRRPIYKERNRHRPYDISSHRDTSSKFKHSSIDYKLKDSKDKRSEEQKPITRPDDNRPGDLGKNKHSSSDLYNKENSKENYIKKEMNVNISIDVIDKTLKKVEEPEIIRSSTELPYTNAIESKPTEVPALPRRRRCIIQLN